MTREQQRYGRTALAYVDPGLDPAVDEALKAYIAKRKEEVPDADFFDHYDYIVIGGGAVGLSTAYHLGKHGGGVGLAC